MRDDFIRAIIERSRDDDLRLVFADWLEENGETALSELIRVQIELAKLYRCGNPNIADECSDPECKRCLLRRRERELLEEHGSGWCPELPHVCWRIEGVSRVRGSGRIWDCSFRHGFVSYVSCTEAEWLGVMCQWCAGRGETHVFGQDYPNECPTCHGTGLVGGHGEAICRVAPIEGVILVGKEPWGTYVRQWSGRFSWYRGASIEHPSSDIDGRLWDMLTNFDDENDGGKFYSTESAARAALSLAAVNVVRKSLRLPLLG